MDRKGSELAREDARVSFRSVSKRFGSVLANDGISFDVHRGTFHALLGENGAGKTTLLRMLAGELAPDLGSILVDQEGRRFRSPQDARALGIRLIHQHSVLIPNLTIAENFILDGVERACIPNFKALGDRLRGEARDFGISLEPSDAVWELSTTQRQWLEVFRALFGGGDLLILDEPTALLSSIEGDALLGRLKALTTTGATVILITHKLREVFKFADVVTVLRRGRWVSTRPVPEATESSLAELMVANGDPGPPRTDRVPTSRGSRAGLLIEGVDLSFIDHRGRQVLRSVNFALFRNEILGIAGISGNGQVELARIVAGLQRPTSGSLKKGVAKDPVNRYIPDDRIRVGTASSLSVRDNLALRAYRFAPCSEGGVLNLRAIGEFASAQVSLFQIKTPSNDTPVGMLSGGNIQRVVVARELEGNPDVVVAHNPTAGLDVSTAAFVRARLADVATRGGGVFLISDDLDELLGVADRIAVLHGGAIAGVVERPHFDRILIAELMSGASTKIEMAGGVSK